MIAVGIGCRKDCSVDDVLALMREAIAQLPAGMRPSGLFSIAEKRSEPGLQAAAEAMRLPLTFFDRSVLALVSGKAQSRSPRLEDMFGLPSVAETAALAGAGDGAVLLVTRRASATATCAIAGPGPHP